MRNLGSMLVVALLLVVGLVAFLLWGPLGEKPGVRELPEEPSQPAAGAAAPAAEAGRSGEGRPAGRAPAGTKTAEAEPLATGEVVGSPAVPTPSAGPARTFPVASDMPLGTDKSSIQASFGRPTMRTTAVERGNLLETWVYLRSDPNTATFVLLRNGRVVSVSTTVY